MKNQNQSRNRQSSGTDHSGDFVGTVPAVLPDRYRRHIQTGGKGCTASDCLTDTRPAAADDTGGRMHSGGIPDGSSSSQLCRLRAGLDRSRPDYSGAVSGYCAGMLGRYRHCIGALLGLFRLFIGTRSSYTALTFTRSVRPACGSCTLIFPALPRFFCFSMNGTRAGFSPRNSAFCAVQNSDFSRPFRSVRVYFKRTLSAPYDSRFLRSHRVHFEFLYVPKIAGILSERSAIFGHFQRISERFAAPNRG